MVSSKSAAKPTLRLCDIDEGYGEIASDTLERTFKTVSLIQRNQQRYVITIDRQLSSQFRSIKNTAIQHNPNSILTADASRRATRPTFPPQNTTMIVVRGPDGKGTIYVVAEKSDGQWSFSTLKVAIQPTGELIDLMGP